MHVVAEPLTRSLDHSRADVRSDAAGPEHAGEHVRVHALGVQGQIDHQLGELVGARFVGGGHARDRDGSQDAHATRRGRPRGVVDRVRGRRDVHLSAVVGSVGLASGLEEGGDALHLLVPDPVGGDA